VLALGIATLYWLFGWRPLQIQLWLVVDDGLYVRQAEGFLAWLQGKSAGWLGAFDCFLLAKAPLYGVWLALVNLLGIPLRVAEFLLVLSGAFLFRRAFAPVRKLRFVEFLLVLFLLVANPFLPGDFRLQRFGLQMALTNLCLVSLVGLCLRLVAPVRQRIVWSASAGLFFGLAYLNREDAAWLLGPLLTAFALQWFLPWLTVEGRRNVRSRVKADLAVLACVVIAALVPVLTVCSLNKAHYGAFMTTFRHSSALTGLYHRLTSLEPSGHQPYVPIARPTRLKAYALSPTFAKMQPFLEGNDGYWHAGNEQAALNGHPAGDKEFFVSYFEFSLLWAAEKMGAKRAGEMEAIFRSIDRELAEAVRAKKIEAGRSGPALLAAPVAGDFRKFLSALGTSVWSLLFVSGDDQAFPSGGQSGAAQLERVGRLTHAWPGPLPAPHMQYSMRARSLRIIRKIQHIFYPFLFVALPAVLFWRRHDLVAKCLDQRTILLWTALVPYVALLAFCAGMSVVEILGFRGVASGDYNKLGFSALTVLAALAVSTLTTFVAVVPEPAKEPARPSLPVEAP